MGYFNIELKPTLTGANCVTAFDSADLLADWEIKTVPTKKPFRVLGTTCVMRGTNGATQASNYELIFASPSSDGTVPSSLGTVNATLNGTGFFRHLVGIYNVGVTADTIDTVNISTDDNTDGNSLDILVIEPSRVINANGSYGVDGHGVNGKICIGVSHVSGAADFGAGVISDGGISVDDTSLTVKTIDARNAFAVGDVLEDNGGATVGTISAIDSATSITLASGATQAVADDDELCNVNPVTFIIHCEY
tara:strand:- start:338 stop:1087 length:750 start_codon:yes stop_codon:yes gene_type:complete